MRKIDVVAILTFICVFCLVWFAVNWIETYESKYAVPTLVSLFLSFAGAIYCLVNDDGGKR